MQLLAYYVAFMITGDFLAYFIGLVIERQFGGQVSLIAFLTLYFLSLWVSWLLAMRVTEPKHAEGTASGAA
jgi:hypothetical protein